MWEPIQRELENIATVCSYDRAGLGWSESAREPRRLERGAIELHTLLANAGIKPPYVLVGHSYGGLLSRIFARDYRSEVSGLALVDSTEEHFITRPEFLAIWRIARLPIRRRALAAVFGLMRLWLLWRPSEASLPGGFSATARASYRAFLCGRKHWWATLDEVGSLFEPDERTFLSQCGSFGRLDGVPTTVISAGLPVPRNAPQFQVPGVMSPDEFDRLHHESQERLAKLLSNSELIVAEKSGHMINFDQPSIVIEAIRHIVIAARAGRLRSD